MPTKPGEYASVFTKKGRVKTRKRIEIMDLTPDEERGGDVPRRKYTAWYTFDNGKKLSLTKGTPIKVQLPSFETMEKIYYPIPLPDHYVAVKENGGRQGHKIAFIEDFFCERPLDKKYTNKGVGSGTFDLLLKELHEEGVDFITMNPTDKSRDMIQKRGFVQWHGRNVWILTKERLLEQVERMKQEDKL